MAREIYTHSHDQVVLDAHGSRTAEEAAAFVKHLLRPEMRILDAGCGPGSITCGLGRWVPDGEVVGVDSSATVLEHARSRAAADDLPNVTFEQADVYGLSHGAGSFDVVFAHQLLQHLGNPVLVLQEFRRVLRPGGVVAVRDADYGTMTFFPHDPDIDRFFEIYALVARANGGEPDAGRRLLAWVQRAGFTNPTYTTSSWSYSTPEERKRWANLWTDRTSVSKYVDRVEELGVASEPEVRSLGAALQVWAAEPDATFSVLHGEVVARTN